MINEPRYLEDLTMLDWHDTWEDFLWGLEGSSAWQIVAPFMRTHTNHIDEIDDLCRQCTFIRPGRWPTSKPRKKIERIDTTLIPDDPGLEPSSPHDEGCILSKIVYEKERQEYTRDPKKWRDSQQGRGNQTIFEFTLIVGCSEKRFATLLRKLFVEYSLECRISTTKALRAQGTEESYLEFHEFRFKVLNPDEYSELGFSIKEVFISREKFRSNTTPDEYYRWRGLKMSHSHMSLARALHIRGFLFSCEAPVFPQDREDKSFITPDIIVFSQGRTLILEVDGPSHQDHDQAFRDYLRDQMWKSNGFETLRFPAWRALTQPHDCISEIVSHLKGWQGNTGAY